jgi:hypothetical protein
MTAFRLISLPLHGAFELLVGLALMAAPFLLGLSPAGTVVGVAIGAIVAGLALRAAGDPDLDVSAHYAADQGLVLGLVAAAIVLAVAGDGLAALLFVAGAAASLALNLVTRYSAAR